FYLAIPVGTAAGYILGGKLSLHHGWRFPFYVAAIPGFLLALSVLFLAEPERGRFDSLKETAERGTLLGLARNPAFWTVTLSMALGVPVMIVALFSGGHAMIAGIWAAAFLLLLNTAPLNAALINSVGAHIRATAIAVNIFIFHLLGDVPSPSLLGYIADRHSLQTAFI